MFDERQETYAAMDLAALEMLEIHRLCDHAKVGREAHGEKLSAAQRVGLVVDRLRTYQ